MLGQSYVMGAGVNDGETFEALIEERLNRELSPATGFRYESLNFAVSGYSLDKMAHILQNGQVSAFHPDVVLIVGYPGDEQGVIGSLVRQVDLGLALSEPVTTWLTEAGVKKGMPETEAVARLKQRGPDLVRLALETIASEARRLDAQAVYALIPIPGIRGRHVTLVSAAADAGLLAIDLRDVYLGHDPRLLTLSERDHHPNKDGHQIIADRLYGELSNMPLGILAAEDSMTVEDQVRLGAEWNRKQVDGQQALEASVGVQPGAPTGRTRRPAANTGDSAGGRRAGRPGGRAGNAAADATDIPAAPLPIEGWAVETREGNVATLVSQRAENWMRVTIEKLASRSLSNIRLRKGPVSVTRDHRYVLKFWMQADAARPVTCGMASGTSAEQLLGTSTKVDAGTWWQEFSCSFKATATDANARIFFDLGTSEAALELSRVELRDLSTGTVVMSTDPAWKPPASKVR